uniref:Maelstrom spermatogenic transposon silencer n=1 Tax=Malurus cyaneus samueli TaxID=2593467 RepID=A0A8C5T494_9PASS
IYGKLPPQCEQRFLPCEIGCVRYSLRDGIMADFHHFIDAGFVVFGFFLSHFPPPLGDQTHKIPISGFHLPRSCYEVVLRELLEFAKPASGAQPRFFCRVWSKAKCSESQLLHWELLAIEDLIVELYQKKYQKEPSETWMYRKLDVCLWDFSTNTRCKWHEENDIMFCALASCKKIGYCISQSFASVYGVPLTAAHLPLQDSCDQSTNTRIVKLDGGHFQVRFFQLTPYFSFKSRFYLQTVFNLIGHSPRGVKTSPCGTSVVQGRGVTRLLRSTSDLSKSFSN